MKGLFKGVLQAAVDAVKGSSPHVLPRAIMGGIFFMGEGMVSSAVKQFPVKLYVILDVEKVMGEPSTLALSSVLTEY